jgi:hypothetical protein
LIIDVSDKVGSITHLGNATEFSIPLFEPLIIDKLSDVYLDSFLTHNSHVCHTGNKMGFALKINEFNVNSNVASSDESDINSKQHVYNSILIPNENNDAAGSAFSCVIHKGKKMNYVCSINPGKISTITGKISDLAGEPIYYTGRFYIVKITTTSAAVDADTSFTFDGVNKNFKTSFYMESGATDLYFYETSAASFDATTLTTNEISTTSTTGLDTKTCVAGTGRNGDPGGRFIAEFVIVARE